jgi:ketosteroid isomerase-like protein
MSAEDEVRSASRRFYLALNRMANGDNSLMAEIWSHSPAVTTMHPIGGREVGWDAVRASFQGVSDLAVDGEVGLEEQLIRVKGDLAYELGVERGRIKLAELVAKIEQRVTNIYERQGGAWRIVHHHADTSPEMLAILAQLQAR